MLTSGRDRPAARTRRLPPPDQEGRAQADHPDLRDRRVVLAGRGHGPARPDRRLVRPQDKLSNYVAQARNVYSRPDHGRPARRVHPRQLPRHRCRHPGDRGGGADDGRPRHLRPPDPARSRHPGGRPGPRVRGPDGGQLHRGDPDDVPDRRRDGRRCRHPLHGPDRDDPAGRRLHPGRQGVHRRGHGRHRQPARRPRWAAWSSASRRTGAPPCSATQWKDVVAFVLLVLILLVRPTGILGESLAKARA